MSVSDKTETIGQIRIDQVAHDGDLQMRDAGVDAGIVAEYAEAMNDGAKFPPITVFVDGDRYWMADGFHRLAASKKIGRETIEADVRQGSRRDAVLHAVGVNANHGLRRTLADKRRAITAMLRDPDWAKWSDREIGKRCAVDGKTVAKIRAELTADFRSDDFNRTYTTKHGTTATMKVFANAKPDGVSIMGHMLAQASDDALIAECRRRNLEVMRDAG